MNILATIATIACYTALAAAAALAMAFVIAWLWSGAIAADEDECDPVIDAWRQRNG